MELTEYKKDSYEFSKITSDLVRQFAFAGIAIIWLFRVENSNSHILPQALIVPLILLVITLICDLFQYLIPTIIWTVFYRKNEKKICSKTNIDIKAPKKYSLPGWIFFYMKISFLIIGYFLLLVFLLGKL